MKTSLESFHEKLVADLFGPTICDGNAFLVFHILHNYEIQVRPEVFADGGSLVVPPITQRHAAACLAGLWSGVHDDRGKYEHWYHRWNGDWGSYGHSESLTPTETARRNELLTRFRLHAWVVDLTLEE